MTKLFQWMILLGLFLAIWYKLIVDCNRLSSLASYELHIYLIPIYAAAMFGLISLAIICQRVTAVKDCPEAATELKKELEEAKQDLTAKGFKFR